MPAPPLHLRLAATSANLGPGFDALGLAMDFSLHITAQTALEDSIAASGRNLSQVGDVNGSLVLRTYRNVLADRGLPAAALALDIRNEIPLGMGCGSSAAALVAGVALASHFGGLGWSPQQILTEASMREGHPDNVAACVLGGLTVSAIVGEGSGTSVAAVSLAPVASWPLLLVLPETSLSTRRARALLPDTYSRADAIGNLQRVALLTAAFAYGRGDLLAEAMRDQLHQPYRAAVCPLLPLLLPLAGQGDVLGVALSGAGPSMLLVLREDCDPLRTWEQIRLRLGTTPAEILQTRIAGPSRVTA